MMKRRVKSFFGVINEVTKIDDFSKLICMCARQGILLRSKGQTWKSQGHLVQNFCRLILSGSASCLSAV